MDERIDIVITDKVDASTAVKIGGIGQAADIADKAISRLKATLGAIGGADLGKMTQAMASLAASLPKIATAQAIVEKSNIATAESYLKLETALNRAVQAEGRAAQQLAVTSAVQSKAAIAAAQVSTAYLEQERALFRALTAEQQLATATANAGLAQLKLKTALETRRAVTAAATSVTIIDTSALSGYTSVTLQAVTATLDLNRARAAAGAYSAHAGGLQAAVSTGYGSTAGSLLGFQNPFGAGAAPRSAASGFAPSAGGGYNVSVQSLNELSAASADLVDKQTKVADVADKAGAAVGRQATRNRLAGHEVANLSFQLQDIAVSLAGGQNPFMVLLQQGAQIQGIYSMRGEGVGRVFGDIGAILLRLVTPATVAAAAFGGMALAVGLFADKAGDIQRVSALLGVTAEQAQVLQRTLNILSRGNMDFGQFTKTSKDFALLLDNAARNPKSQANRLFEVNNKSITDGNGQLKDQNILWKDAIGLIQGAANEVQAIKIGDILGLQEDFTREVYKSQKGFTDVQTEVTKTGTLLDNETVKRAADFERAWGTAWQKFLQGGSDAITAMEAALATFFDRIEQNKSIQKWIEANIPQNGATPAQVQNFFQPATPPGMTLGPGGGLVRTDGRSNTAPLLDQLGQLLSKGLLPTLQGQPTGDLSEAQAEAQRARFRASVQSASTLPNRPDATLNQSAPSTGGPARAVINPGGGTVVPSDAPPAADKTQEKRADALAKVNRELDAQLKLMGMLGPARAVEQQMSEIENQLLGKKVDLTATEKAGLRDKVQAIQDALPVQAALNKLYEEAQGPLRDYNATVAAGTKLLADGVISAQQYGDATREAWEKVLVAQNTFSSGIELGFSQVYGDLQGGAQTTADAVKQAFSGVQDAFVQLASTGTFSFSSFTTSILADIAKIIYQLYILKPLMQGLGLSGGGGVGSGFPLPVTGGPGQSALSAIGNLGQNAAGLAGGGGIGGFLGGIASWAGSLLGFDNGADMDVRGSSGRDRNVMAFRVSDGERVTVTPAQANAASKSGRSSGTGDVQINFVNNTGQQQTARQTGKRQTSSGKTLIDVVVEKAVAAVAGQFAQGGNDLTNAAAARFGLNQATGNQQ